MTGASAAGAADAPAAGGPSVSAVSTVATATAGRTVPVADGAFVVVRENGEVYRVVGGAPVYVSSWAAIGGPRPTTAISLAQLRAMPLTPADGTFVVGAQRGEVYRFVGGAPVYVSSWAAFGRAQPVTIVDDVALDNAGRAGVWSHVRATPADGTFVVGAQRGEVYRFAGGAPLYVTSWAPFGEPQPATAVDIVALDNAGQAGVWSHVRATPADGTFVVGGVGWGHVYRFAGGAPVYVGSWSPFGGPRPVTVIDHSALDFAGVGGAFNHVNFYPADGTYLHAAQTDRVYQVQGGIALYVADWSLVGGPKPTTTVDGVALQHFGGLQFVHLRGVGTL